MKSNKIYSNRCRYLLCDNIFKTANWRSKYCCDRHRLLEKGFYWGKFLIINQDRDYKEVMELLSR